ncbi:MAG: hypothetical protein PHT21_13100, partial [Lachnospiraceae bacterium]|nr:hypothetical protein [Lachnospiraceae bacterium]
LNQVAARRPAKAVAQFFVSTIKRSGNQVLKVVLLNHHKITIKQDRHCHHYENNTIYWLVFQALLL